jgi:hypothetical protein
MRAIAIFVGLLSVCFIGVLVPACGSNSPSTAGTDAAPDAGGENACPGLEAAEAMISFTASCFACVTAHCCSQAQTCAGDPACIAVVKCQIACTQDGGVPMTCAETCVDDTDSGTGSSDATSFDLCLAASCMMQCVQ